MRRSGRFSVIVAMPPVMSRSNEVGERVRAAIEVYGSLGVGMREVEIPHLPETLKAQRYILAADAYAIHEERLKSAPERFDDEVLDRLLEGERLKAHRYARAEQRRIASQDEFEAALGEADVLLAPTVPIAAPLIDQSDDHQHRQEPDAVHLSLGHGAVLRSGYGCSIGRASVASLWPARLRSGGCRDPRGITGL